MLEPTFLIDYMQGTLMYDIEVTVENKIQLNDLQQRIQNAIKTFPEVTGNIELADTVGFEEDDEPTEID